MIMNRYLKYGIIILVIILFILFCYWFYVIPDFWYKLKCYLSTPNGACFANLSDTSCQDLLEPGKSPYIWCNDINNRGAILGDKNGPYFHTCKDWIADPMRCPPRKCTDLKQSRALGLSYGWCADADKMRAMLGDQCGPDSGTSETCKNWVWQSKDCRCNVTGELLDTTIPRPGKSCNIVCGHVNGEYRDCNNLCQGFSTTSDNICGHVKSENIPCPAEQNDTCRCK